MGVTRMGKTTIFLADDDEGVRRTLRTFFEGLPGYRVVGEACDGMEAVEGCRASAPDVALLDIQMPLLDGVSVARQVLADRAAKCVIILTAFSDREHIELVQACGAAVTRLYPAKSYGLIVFSHGSGWLPPHTLVNGSRSIIIDNDNEMEITDFAMALPDHLFEFIIFEACNMAGIEVAYELRNKAAYIMASSAPVVSPGFTPIYAGSISCLLEENADLQRFAENYFHYWNLMEGDKRSATISIIKTAGLSNLANLIRQINTEASGSFLPVGNLQNYDGVLKAPFYFFDFAQYYQSLSDENTYNALQECISQCVVYKRNTPFYATEEGTFPITAFSGMTTFIMQRELNDLNEEYTKLQWYKDINTH